MPDKGQTPLQDLIKIDSENSYAQGGGNPIFRV